MTDRKPSPPATVATGAEAAGGRPDAAVDPAPEQGPLVESELLVEEISIDGMCGVY